MAGGVVTLLGAAGGCAGQRPIDAWQDSLARYVEREGHGDPSILRDSPALRSPNALRPGVIRFSKLNVRGPGLFDVHGVMLDTGTPERYAFLVGVVRRPSSGRSRLEDVRLVLCEFDRSTTRWKVSPPDPEALAAYVRAVSDGDEDLPRHPHEQVFPALDDVFEYEVESGVAVARHPRSGAAWRVDLEERAVLSSRR
jgi:hypothetical protein